MALDADCLGESIINTMERFHALQPNTQIGVTVLQTPKEDGTLDTVVEPIMGRPRFDRDAVTPLAYAIAYAVVEHLAAHAEAVDDPAAPTVIWRIR